MLTSPTAYRFDRPYVHKSVGHNPTAYKSDVHNFDAQMSDNVIL